MKIKIIEEKYIGNISKINEIICKSNFQAISAVDRLNGKDHNSVVFLNENDGNLFVGGGSENKYVATLSLATDGEIMALENRENSNEDFVDLVVGGQRGSYKLRQCVEKNLIIKAVLYFYQFGKPDPELEWENE